MFKIEDGRESFYQWDLDRRLIVNDAIKQVHYCNKTDECSLVTEVYEENGIYYSNVPNVLLQTDWNVNVYGYDAHYTKHSAKFKVIARTKPADYIYTETEVLTVDRAVEIALEEAKASGAFKGDKGDKGDSGTTEVIIVTELPTEDIKNAIYLLPTGNTGENKYNEYIYTSGEWEKIGGTSIDADMSEYVKFTDYATNLEAGVIKWNTAYGNEVKNGMLRLIKATDNEIGAKNSIYKPIVPNNLDYAVKVGVTTNTYTLTDEEKASATGWLGAVSVDDWNTSIGNIETALDNIIAIQAALIGGES